MTFDEQLQRTLDTFTSRLNEEVTHQVRAMGDELVAAARAYEAAELAAAARASEAAELAAAARVNEALELAAAARENELAALAAGARANEAAELAAASRANTAAEPPPESGRLADGIRALGAARSLSEVLDTLVNCASQEAPRAGIVLLRGDRFYGWRFLGFDPPFESGDVNLAADAAGVIAHAAQSLAVASLGPDNRDDAPAFAQLPLGRASVALPLAIAEQVVAVLYADAGLNAEPAAVNVKPLEILTRFAAQRLEALTAIKAARSLTLAPRPPAPEDGRDDASGDEQAAARRYARLLVSEIKLYYEPQVAEGRRERDLATRLGGEIARVRTLYEQRVPPAVRRGTDYVHEELIRTLADGDASLLEAKSG